MKHNLQRNLLNLHSSKVTMRNPGVLLLLVAASFIDVGESRPHSFITNKEGKKKLMLGSSTFVRLSNRYLNSNHINGLASFCGINSNTSLIIQ